LIFSSFPLRSLRLCGNFLCFIYGTLSIKVGSKQLQESLSSHYEYEKLVKYLNYSFFDRYLCKRKNFQHENEFRLIVFYPHEPNNGEFKPVPIPNVGYNVNIDIIQLIENIYISPSAPQGFHELIISVIAKYGYDFCIKQSNLIRDPLF